MAETAPAVRECLGNRALEALLLEALRDRIRERAGSREWVEQYAAICPVEGVGPRAYHLREIELAMGLRVLAGIHFRGLEVREPFVGVLACEGELPAREIGEASFELVQRFSKFGPRRTRWWSPSGASDLRGLPGARGDQRLVGGWLAGLTTPGGTPSLELRCESSGEASYDAYRRIYDELLRACPERRDWIRATDRDLYEECVHAGVLATVRRNGSIHGVLAARPGKLRGIPCWEMIEEVLDASLRGRGLAASIQGRFLELLDPEVEGFVMGTIDDRNLPSYRAALGVGREDLGGWVFVPGRRP